jgi:hypothetical protein
MMGRRVAWWVVVAVAVLGGSAALFFYPNYWGRVDEPLMRVVFIIQLVASIASMVLFARDQAQRWRRPGIAIALGLLAAALFGSGATDLAIELHTPIPHPDLSIFADLLTSCFAQGLIMIAWPRRGKLLWLGLAVLWGGLMLVLRLVGLAMSFM